MHKKIKMLNEKVLIRKFLNDPEFNKYLLDEVGVYEIKVDWNKREILFYTPTDVKVIKVDTVIEAANEAVGDLVQ